MGSSESREAPPPMPGGLPLFIWDYILKYVNDPADVVSLSNVSQNFRSLMQFKSGGELIMPALLKRKEWTKYFQPEDIQRFRLVCKDWSCYIRNHYEDELIKRIRMTDLPLLKPEPGADEKNQMTCKIEDLPTLGKILRDLENVAMIRPLIGRSLMLSVPAEAEQPTFDVGISKLLETVGEEIWELCVLFPPETDEAGIYSNLQSWCTMLPNLKSLGFTRGTLNGTTPEVDFEVNPPFPFLPDLELLQCHNIDVAVIRVVLGANPHVKRILLESRYADINFLRQAQLETLQMKITNFIDIKRPLPRMSSNLKLKHLSLDFQCKSFTQRALFILLRNFPTLETVVLAGDEGVKQSRGDVLDLPNLQVFKCWMKTGRGGIDFLLYCRKLKKLTVCLPYYEDLDMRHMYVNRNNEETVQFRGHFETFGETSNAWTLFPKLEQVSFILGNRTKLYKRHRY